jgi:CelD/BcsL family acetyltransferase involved in cellulose biosynthesis
LNLDPIIPWENPAWDEYVAGHPGGTVYHTSAWIRVIASAGGYTPLCLAARDGASLAGVFPLVKIVSPLTGKRLVSLPFSDTCFPLADDESTASRLLESAKGLLKDHRLTFIEVRGAPALKSGGEGNPESLGFTRQGHFKNYVLPLSVDTAAIKKTFNKTSVRQTINKSFRLGVTVRTGEGERDLDEFYRLYLLNRKRHGIPPQPRELFSELLRSMTGSPGAVNYIAEHEGIGIAALIVLRYKGVTYAKYEGVDDAYRDVLPVYGLLWKAIEDAALAGDSIYDFGRTALDNPGLNAFKSRWGTTEEELPYFFHPPREGLSVVKSSSLKYRLFTGTVRRLPLPVGRWLGKKLFRHFG